MSTMGSDLTTVEVETKLGARYIFPDMPRETLDNVAHQHGWAAAGQLILVNISMAVLSMPLRIVKTVSYDGGVKWTAPGE